MITAFQLHSLHLQPEFNQLYLVLHTFTQSVAFKTHFLEQRLIPPSYVQWQVLIIKPQKCSSVSMKTDFMTGYDVSLIIKMTRSQLESEHESEFHTFSFLWTISYNRECTYWKGQIWYIHMIWPFPLTHIKLHTLLWNQALKYIIKASGKHSFNANMLLITPDFFRERHQVLFINDRFHALHKHLIRVIWVNHILLANHKQNI